MNSDNENPQQRAMRQIIRQANAIGLTVSFDPIPV
jgi:protein tyrosine phosphatase (PTP) superfamily phosphohydrolase (DUF442 family)